MLNNIPEKSDIDGLTDKLASFDMLSSHPGRLPQSNSKPVEVVPPLNIPKTDPIKIVDDNPSLKTSIIIDQTRRVQPTQPFYGKQETYKVS